MHGFYVVILCIYVRSYYYYYKLYVRTFSSCSTLFSDNFFNKILLSSLSFMIHFSFMVNSEAKSSICCFSCFCIYAHNIHYSCVNNTQLTDCCLLSFMFLMTSSTSPLRYLINIYVHQNKTHTMHYHIILRIYIPAHHKSHGLVVETSSPM